MNVTLPSKVPTAIITRIMDVADEHAQQLAELAAATPCSRDNACLTSAPGELCKAKVTDDGRAVPCLEKDGWQCLYSMQYGKGLACTCLVRQYIARHLGGRGERRLREAGKGS